MNQPLQHALPVTIADFAQRINQKISTLSFGDNPSELYEPIRYIMRLGGKRIRPTLTLIAAHLFGNELDHVLLPAIGTEVFHNFSLLHDDIMDKAPLRRGQPTVHEKWNQNIAILSGDVMLVRAYEFFLQVETGKLRKVLTLFSHTAAQVCEGQQLDMNYESSQEVSISDYLHMITLKTAVLLGFSLELGATLNNASENNALLLKNFGINIGIAFQLRDDLLDVYGDREKFGKQVGGDILADKKTFLLLTALEQANPEQKEVFAKYREQAVYSPEQKVQEVTAIYDQLQIKAQTQTKINYYFEEAMQSLHAVDAPAERKEVLQSLAFELMARES
ncbi:polyprenyl synthetase family protein [Adhaeribacter pallidiroseus]|uniref:All-trans-octaprenyl-diphosphate synthase n=1 Tax=Adhaeribacter pallidiroseus TaxID=2072847 RepID=A0A369QU17_9BACT|nr:polyprenyl synthetase family protein [Adhaeribacter pallidiroseus]RDC65658.1 All-trans-octaprenyl-diphosphate synthase [Adhaeribacter pallidiroseus]